MKRIISTLLLIGLLFGGIGIGSATASMNDYPPASDGLQHSCVIGANYTSGVANFTLIATAGSNYEPDGGLSPYSCQTQISFQCASAVWYYWTNYATGPQASSPSGATDSHQQSYTESVVCASGYDIVNWEVQLTNFFDINGNKATWNSKCADIGAYTGWYWNNAFQNCRV